MNSDGIAGTSHHARGYLRVQTLRFGAGRSFGPLIPKEDSGSIRSTAMTRSAGERDVPAGDSPSRWSKDERTVYVAHPGEGTTDVYSRESGHRAPHAPLSAHSIGPCGRGRRAFHSNYTGRKILRLLLLPDSFGLVLDQQLQLTERQNLGERHKNGTLTSQSAVKR